MQKPIKISIDTVTDDTVCNYSNIRKGDTLLMQIDMYQKSANLNLTGQTIHVILAKKDGYSVEKIITGLTSNIIAIAFDEQATICVGEVVGEVQVIDANGCNISNHFSFEVGATNADNVIIASKNELDTLAKIQEVIDDYNNNKVNLDAANALALQNISELGTLNDTGIQVAERLETDIETGDSLDIVLKDDISQGNALDIVLKEDIANGAIMHNTLTIVISDGNNVIAQLQNNANWTLIQQMFELINKMSISNLDDENGDYLVDEINLQFIG